MKQIIKYAVLAASICAYSAANADEESVKKALTAAMPNVNIDAIQASEIPNLYEVSLEGNILYVSEDGKYLLQGHLIDVDAKRDLTEQKLSASRKLALEKIGLENMITFKPKETKYNVYIFTDIDCGYCRKLHSEIDQYMAEGIAVHYLFFPRAGKGSDSYNKAISVWCAADRNAALTAAKSGKDPEKKQCDNPVDKHMALGERFEARGTPLIVTAKGALLPGYVPAKQLAQVLSTE